MVDFRPMHIIDFHAHAFPDKLAARAVPALEKEGGIKAKLDGTVSALLGAMDEAGVAASVVASIATKPEQFKPIIEWSAAIASERLIPFPSVHPADAEASAHVHAIASEGFRGLKLHPYYQDFYLDEERVFPIYEAAMESGLVLLLHTGFDIAFERIRRADPARVLNVVNAFPELKLITSHMGAWEDWEEVEKCLLGKPIYMDLSFSAQFMPPARSRDFLLAHPREYLLFGTDSPWADQGEVIGYIRSLELESEWERAILFENARGLLGLE